MNKTIVSVVVAWTLVLLFGSWYCMAVGREPWLVGREQAAKNDLKILWQHNIPLCEDERLERLYILGDAVYAMSDRNYLTCLVREAGRVRFSSFIAPRGLPVSELALYSGELICGVGRELLEINSEFGTRRSSTSLVRGVTCPVVRNSSNFYIAATDNRLHVLQADNRVQIFEVAPENDSVITSVRANDDVAIFSTLAGNVICIRADRPAKLWQFDAAGGITAPFVLDANSVFVASKDTNLYKLDVETGKLLWKYQAGAMLSEQPQVAKTAVYQRADGAGLDAVDKDSGKLLWHLDDGVGLLSESGKRAYVLAARGTIVVMDNARGRQVRRIEIGSDLRYASNVVDSKICIADRTGRVACLEPLD